MSRHKTPPESLLAKRTLSERIIELRIDLFGEHGKPEMARRLGIPVRSWYNYEEGVTIPGELLLKLIELTSVEPMWLLHGTEPRYRRRDRETGLVLEPDVTAGKLIRAALEILDRNSADVEPAIDFEWKTRRLGARRGRSRNAMRLVTDEESDRSLP